MFQPKSNSSSACPETIAARWKIISGLEETKLLLISFLDISTGEFLCSHGNLDYIKNLLQSFDPKEILISKKNKTHYSDLLRNFNSIFFLDDWIFKKDFSVFSFKNEL